MEPTRKKEECTTHTNPEKNTYGRVESKECIIAKMLKDSSKQKKMEGAGEGLIFTAGIRKTQSDKFKNTFQT